MNLQWCLLILMACVASVCGVNVFICTILKQTISQDKMLFFSFTHKISRKKHKIVRVWKYTGVWRSYAKKQKQKQNKKTITTTTKNFEKLHIVFRHAYHLIYNLFIYNFAPPVYPFEVLKFFNWQNNLVQINSQWGSQGVYSPPILACWSKYRSRKIPRF